MISIGTDLTYMCLVSILTKEFRLCYPSFLMLSKLDNVRSQLLPTLFSMCGVESAFTELALSKQGKK